MSARGGDGASDGGPLRPSAQSTIVEAPAEAHGVIPRDRVSDPGGDRSWGARRSVEGEETGAATPGARRREHDGEDTAGPVPVGSVLDGRYRLLELIGQGGMGAVYRARDMTLDAEVAVKVLDREVAGNPKLVEYFRNEVRTARKVTHPNVCRLHDLVEVDGLWLITMQYVDGSSLADRLRESGVVPVAEAVRILRDVAAGLGAAHAAGVVHRDLKPANVLIATGNQHELRSSAEIRGPDGLAHTRSPRSARARAIVADFGIAAEVNRLGVATMDVAGTRGYMSPEQAAGRPVDARTDVYAFGVLAHRMLTGQVPPTAPTRVGATDVGGPAADMPPDVSPGLLILIDQCLSGDPGVRPADGRVLVSRLAALEERRDPTPKLVDAETAAPAPRRRPGRWLALAAVLVAGAGAATLAVWRPWRSGPVGPLAGSAREIRFEPLLAAALAPEDAALPDSIVRLTIDELEDAWSMPARAADDGGPPPDPGTAHASGRLFVTRDRHLVLEVELARAGGGTVTRRLEASGPRPLAIDLARWIVESSVETAARHPTADERARVCAGSDEAWRLWRRAQRESRMQRWGTVRTLIAQAVAIDPRFAMAHVELAFSYMLGDEAMTQAYRRASESMCPTLDAHWKKTLAAAELVWGGEMKKASQMFEEVMADPAVSSRDKQYLATRWAFGLFFGGLKTEGLSRLEWIADQYPSDAAAAKLLANHYLSVGDPAMTATARRFAEKALAIAPYDLAVRADLARALLLAGDVDGARRHARIIDRADPAEKQMALAGNEAENSLASLHLELGDLDEAERDARRLLLGSPTEMVQGGLAMGTIDLLRGAFGSGIDRLGAAADVAAESGVGTVAIMLRWKAAFAAYHAGELERGRAQLAKLTDPAWKLEREVLTALIDHKAAPPAERAHLLAHAKTSADSLPGLARLQLLEVVAHARGDWDAVLGLQDQVQAATRSRQLTARYLAADAHAGRGELKDAIDGFEHLVADPHAWKEPVLATRAWRRLGDLKSAQGDRAGAARAYQELVSRWTMAPPGNPDLSAARAALEQLNSSTSDSTLPP